MSGPRTHANAQANDSNRARWLARRAFAGLLPPVVVAAFGFACNLLVDKKFDGYSEASCTLAPGDASLDSSSCGRCIQTNCASNFESLDPCSLFVTNVQACIADGGFSGDAASRCDIAPTGDASATEQSAATCFKKTCVEKNDGVCKFCNPPARTPDGGVALQPLSTLPCGACLMTECRAEMTQCCPDNVVSTNVASCIAASSKPCQALFLDAALAEAGACGASLSTCARKNCTQDCTP